ncbi:RNA-guided endonuclease InsQ/TnpB family protein [Tengunoibacter tsumagoiensis]|uniref:Transposase n=1 Tax=Tengunoibacter tsumagoiensis TaxID=2014871 RepID=A0A401ZV95_9CHLR|nr:RNA-guided endonuclease TnpB family protein [Tengunoibacter tsumagoiensis]GCE10644.1 transposase [Tengunoibacter tsumagoiensis]
MHRVEKHVIDQSDPRYTPLDTACFASKNLYNAALYEVRQVYIHEGTYLNYNAIDRLMQSHETYKALPAKVAQQVLLLLDRNWTSFFEALKAHKADPSKFRRRPQLPAYKHKTTGRNVLIYTMQAVSRSKRTLGQRLIQPSGLGIQIKTQQDPKMIAQVRVVPKHGFVVVEVVYEQEEQPTAINSEFIAGIDPGLNNVIALTSNKPDFVPVIVNGRGLKSTNQFYNKRRAALQQALGRPGNTRRMQKLTIWRNRRIEHDLHGISRFVIDLLVAEGIGTLVIGRNVGWKQEINLGKRINQNFVQLPHAKLINLLTYKAEHKGIRVILTEEAYTSKASFLDDDSLPTYQEGQKSEPVFSGKRITRGLYQASDGRLINADCNGSLNVIRKVAPDAFGSEGVEDGKRRVHLPVVHPVRLSFPYKPARVKIPAPVRIH